MVVAGNTKLVGEERQSLPGLGLLVSDSAQMSGIVRWAGGAGECDSLIRRGWLYGNRPEPKRFAEAECSTWCM